MINIDNIDFTKLQNFQVDEKKFLLQNENLLEQIRTW